MHRDHYTHRQQNFKKKKKKQSQRKMLTWSKAVVIAKYHVPRLADNVDWVFSEYLGIPVFHKRFQRIISHNSLYKF